MGYYALDWNLEDNTKIIRSRLPFMTGRGLAEHMEKVTILNEYCLEPDRETLLHEIKREALSRIERKHRKNNEVKKLYPEFRNITIKGLLDSISFLAKKQTSEFNQSRQDLLEQYKTEVTSRLHDETIEYLCKRLSK